MRRIEHGVVSAIERAFGIQRLQKKAIASRARAAFGEGDCSDALSATIREAVSLASTLAPFGFHVAPKVHGSSRGGVAAAYERRAELKSIT